MPTARAVPLFFLNHRLSRAPVLLRDDPLMAMDITKPKTKIRNSTWKVANKRTVNIPTITRQLMMTLIPKRSYRRPKKGWLSPLTKNPRDAAQVMVDRLSRFRELSIGSTKAPKAFLEPTVARAMKKTVATMNQP